MIELTGVYARDVLGAFFTYNMLLIMTMIFSVLIAILLINYREILQSFRAIKRKTWLILLVIFAIGFVLRNDSYFYGWGYDGLFYTDTASTLAENGVFAKGCAIGNLYDCKLYHQVLFPAGFPYLIAVLYLLFGQNAIFGMMLSGIFGSFAIIIVFLIGYTLFKREEIGLYSAMIFTLIPIDILISGSGAVRPMSTFFMALSVLFFLLALEKNKIRFWSLFAITLSYSIYVRQENSILLIPMASFFITKYRKELSSCNMQKITTLIRNYWLPLIIFFISQIPVQYWILFADVGWNGGNPIFSPFYFYYTAPVMLTLLFTSYLWFRALFNPLVSVIFFIGLYFLFSDKEKGKILLPWVWFLVFFALNSSWFLCQGYPQNNCIGNIVRYMTTLSLPYSLISGFVLFRISSKIRINKVAFITASFVFIFVTSFFFSGLSLPNSFMKDGRLDEEYIGDALRAINRTDINCLLFVSQSSLPNSDLLEKNERRWIDIDLILNGTLNWVWEEVKNSSCIVYISDYRCAGNIDEQCNFIYKNFDMEFLFKENSVEAYRLELKKM